MSCVRSDPSKPRAQWDGWSQDITSTSTEAWTCIETPSPVWTGLYDGEGNPIWRHYVPRPVGFLHHEIERLNANAASEP
jgi:hypothetical protein